MSRKGMDPQGRQDPCRRSSAQRSQDVRSGNWSSVQPIITAIVLPNRTSRDRSRASMADDRVFVSGVDRRARSKCALRYIRSSVRQRRCAAWTGNAAEVSPGTPIALAIDGDEVAPWLSGCTLSTGDFIKGLLRSPATPGRSGPQETTLGAIAESVTREGGMSSRSEEKAYE